ncbi:hypothetical protein [Corallococcus sp. 4LFB]|uniref:hypothetical protein n=1 Tax=Corallococcus sp. 4LFB TaxID=3383249 RepID=UPI0039765CA7
MSTRRQFLSGTALAAGALAVPGAVAAEAPARGTPRASAKKGFWPGGARLAISLSLQFEAGAQPERGASSPFPPIDVSRDEPFVVDVRGRPFAVVPYTLGMNDIINFESRNYTADHFASELKHEFDALYAEAGERRRMMSISMHDRISGRPGRVKMLEEFIRYAQRQPGVWFARKDALARWTLEQAGTRGAAIQAGRLPVPTRQGPSSSASSAPPSSAGARPSSRSTSACASSACAGLMRL